MNAANEKVLDILKQGNKTYLASGHNEGDVSPDARLRTAKEGQHPYAIVITCSDSRVIPETIFSAGIGDIFVIRLAGNVLDNHQLGSIEYAFSHLDANLIVMLGHTKCGAISAALNSHGGSDKFIKYIIDDIHEAIGSETNEYKATVLNVKHGVNIIRKAFHDHPDIEDGELDVIGALYDIETGKVEWVQD
ncbi:MAG: carbonic anhydrase [Eubacterium sp.]|nr:carbonic anhydrase [Eubacterium sp.]